MPTDNANRGDDSYRSGGASRPSLLGPGKFSDTRPGSILHTLEKPQASAATQKPAVLSGGMVWKLGVLALVIVSGLAWTQWRTRHATPAPTHVAQASQGATGVVEAPTRAADPVVTSASAAVTEAEAAPTAARIEQMPVETPPAPATDAASTTAPTPVLTPVAPATAASTAPAAAATVVAGAAAGAAAAVVATAEPAKPQPAPVAAKAKPKASSANDARVAQAAAHAKSSTAASQRTSTTAAKAVRAKTGDKPARRDTDVDIVSALIAGIDAPPAGDDLAIADLVSSCRGGQSKEALACRARICKGYWGKADACPARNRKAAERAARELHARN